MEITLFFKDASGAIVNRHANVPASPSGLPPAIVTWNDGPRTRYFGRYHQSRDFYESQPVSVSIVGEKLK